MSGVFLRGSARELYSFRPAGTSWSEFFFFFFLKSDAGVFVYCHDPLFTRFDLRSMISPGAEDTRGQPHTP